MNFTNAVWDQGVLSHMQSGAFGKYLYDNYVRLRLTTQENFRVVNPVYDGKNLVSSRVRIYNDALDAELDMNPIKELDVTATYDTQGRMLGCKSIEAV